MTKEKTLDSQIVRAKENLNLDHGGPSQRQASDTNPPMKGLGQGVFKYVLKRVSFGSKDCTKELKPECAYFLGH